MSGKTVKSGKSGQTGKSGKSGKSGGSSNYNKYKKKVATIERKVASLENDKRIDITLSSGGNWEGWG